MEIVSCTDHIMVIDNTLSKEGCDELIDYFHNLRDAGFGGADSFLMRKDFQLPTQTIDSLTAKDPTVVRRYNENFWQNIYPLYLNEFVMLEGCDRHVIEAWKIQETKIGGGFHGWHCEASGVQNLRRLLVFTTYLNDVEEGGETEFLVQGLRCKAKAGRTVVWPAYFTHPHRGNPPISNTKYIVTGWVEFQA